MTDPPENLNGARLLLVDDTPANLDVLCALFETQGADIALARDGAQALKVAARLQPELILLDVIMPGLDGYTVCRRLKQDETLKEVPVVFITARDQPEDIVQGFQAGGVDYVTKPFRDEEVLARVRTHLAVYRLSRILARQNEELADKNAALEAEITQRQKLSGQLSRISQRETAFWGLEEFVGESATMQDIFEQIRLAQEYAAPVLITGESGTGKELVARAVHHGSPRRDSPFVPLNCAAIPAELAEAELFGHAKGAFTGADDDRPGCFETAHEGTLFLDELGELPLPQQAKLLRVLEDGQVRRVGSGQERSVDVRVVAATNADLPARIQTGAFRADLYYRLARLAVTVPPLRQRREDIPLLARHFLQVFAAEMGCEPPALEGVTAARLQAYSFPGNVRELKNVVERALIESRGAPLEPVHLHLPDEPQEIQLAAGDTPDPSQVGLPVSANDEPLVTLEAWERAYILRVLERVDWVITGPQGAAAVLGLPPSTLRNRMIKLGIRRPHDRDSGAT
ncbi:MAG: response regulator [Candidatus Latescibacteria bacterium]|nr:response regulator [Candidatus Latescibacterota bacterium]